LEGAGRIARDDGPLNIIERGLNESNEFERNQIRFNSVKFVSSVFYFSMHGNGKKIYICQGRWCRELGSERILEKVKEKLTSDDVEVSGCRCTGYCERGVSVIVDGKIVHDVTEENVFDKIADTTEHRDLHAPVEVEIEDLLEIKD